LFFQFVARHVCYRWIFPLYFQLPYLPEDTCFQQGGSSAVEGTSQWKVLASLSLFLKSEKIPALPYGGKGRKRTSVEVLPWFSTCSLSLLASSTDLKAQKGL
jgi:hypothetical protein